MSKKVLVAFIQDRSGSMAGEWSECLSGFKKFVEDLREGGKKDDIDYLLTLTVFDTLVETPIKAKPINDVNLDELANHGPRGCTALYDATGITIDQITKNDHGAEKIICVIVTDGHENSSREWNKTGLHAKVDSLINSGKWTFTYLGTQPETWGDAGAIGVGPGASATYVGAQAKAAYANTSAAINHLSASCRSNSRALYQDFGDETMMKMAGMKVSTKDDVPDPVPDMATAAKPSTANWRGQDNTGGAPPVANTTGTGMGASKRNWRG